MSTYYTDEKLTVAAGATATLTATKLDNTGGPRASSALIENSLAANSDILYRFGTTPPGASGGHHLAPGEKVVIAGYDNLKSLQFYGAGASASSIFISYAA